MFIVYRTFYEFVTAIVKMQQKCDTNECTLDECMKWAMIHSLTAKGTTQDRVFTDGACVVVGWEEAPNVGVVLVLSHSVTDVDLRTIPMAL